MTEAQELPEGFVWHRDCIIDIEDALSHSQYAALNYYIAEHYDDLAEYLTDEYDVEDEIELDILIEDFTFFLLFPTEYKRKEQLEHSLALIAYEKRGLGECCNCTNEINAAEFEEGLDDESL